MALTYNTFTTSLANMIVVPLDDPAFVAALPNIIDDAEQRLYRELDLLSARGKALATLTPFNRAFTLPTLSTGLSFRVVDQMNVCTPVGSTTTLNPLSPVSADYLDALWPSSTVNAGLPTMFAPVTDQVWNLGPSPDAAYTMQVVGTFRPAPLSVSNQTTLLTTLLPDVFLAAALVFSAGYQLNFSAMGDNPQAGVTWETHVKTLLDSAKVEEIRKKFGSQGWTSKEPDALATPPRT